MSNKEMQRRIEELERKAAGGSCSACGRCTQCGGGGGVWYPYHRVYPYYPTYIGGSGWTTTVLPDGSSGTYTNADLTVTPAVRQ